MKQRVYELILASGGPVIAIGLPLIFNPFQPAAFEPPKVILLQCVTGLMLISWCIMLVKAIQFNTLKSFVSSLHSPLLIPLVAYASVYLLATLFSVDPLRSLWGVSYNRHGLSTILAIPLFTVLLWSTLHEPEQVDLLIKVIILGSIAVTLYGLLQFIGLDPITWATDSVSPVLSSIGRSNFLGAYLAMIMPLTLMYVVAPSEETDRWRYAVVLTLQGLCLLLTLARAALVAVTAGSVLFLFVLAWHRRKWQFMAAGVALIPISIGLYGLTNSIQLIPLDHNPASAIDSTDMPDSVGASYVERREASIGGRMTLWKSTLPLIRQQWLLGYGPDTFADLYAANPPPEMRQFEGEYVTFDDPHNLFIQQLIETGVIGLVTLFSVVAVFYYMTLWTLAATKSVQTEMTLAALLGSGTAFLVQSQFNPDMIITLVFFGLVLAMATAIHRQHLLTESDPILTSS